jgi:hypothetical protein
MNLLGEEKRLDLHLPLGYRAQLDPDVLTLRRADGSQVAFFSRRGFVAEAVEQAAWEDYGKYERPSRQQTSSERRSPSHHRFHARPPRPPA